MPQNKFWFEQKAWSLEAVYNTPHSLLFSPRCNMLTLYLLSVLLNSHALWVHSDSTLLRVLCMLSANGAAGRRGSYSTHTFSAQMHALLLHQTSCMKHRFKDKITKNFKIETERQTTCGALSSTGFWAVTQVTCPGSQFCVEGWT